MSTYRALPVLRRFLRNPGQAQERSGGATAARRLQACPTSWLLWKPSTHQSWRQHAHAAAIASSALGLLVGVACHKESTAAPTPAAACPSCPATTAGTPVVGGGTPARAGSSAPHIPGTTAKAAVSDQAEPPPPAPHKAPQPAELPADGCPSNMARVASFCVDRYEAHLAVATSTGAFAAHPHHARPVPGTQYFARSEPRVLPQGYISRIEAAAACENADKRLCSAQEWYQACRGEPATTYGYGTHFINGRCNVGKAHLLSAFFGTNPRAWKYDEHFNNPLMLQQTGYLEPTGNLADCHSSYGTFDMVGNLHEWVSDTVGRSLAYKIPLQDDIRRRLRANAGKGIFMGGFFSTTSQHGRGCGFVTIAHEARYHDYSTGFRCCRDL